MTAFNALLFLIRNVLENIAQAATALTNRQLPYLINYYLWNVLFSKPPDNQRQSVGPPELCTPNTSSPSFSSTQKNFNEAESIRAKGTVYQIHSTT